MSKGNHNENTVPEKERKLWPFVCKDTGIILMIRKVSPDLMRELYQLYPAPQPPMQTVDLGEGQTRQEPNPVHPDYLAAVQAHSVMLQEKMQRLLITRGVMLEMTPEVTAQVAELRTEWHEITGADLDDSDKMLYISKIAVGTPEDLEELINAITRRSQPTDPAIQESLEQFKS